MAMTNEKESLVVRHVGEIYRNCTPNISWVDLNGCLTRATQNAIRAGFTFEPDDFSKLYEKFKGDYWFGTNGNGKGMGECFYSCAVQMGNASACISFEKFADFEPYLFLGRRLCISGHNARSQSEEYGEVYIPKKDFTLNEDFPQTDAIMRASLGRSSVESVHRWHVTSISKEFVVLCSYYGPDNPYGHRQNKPTARKSITHEELDALNKKLRAAMKQAKKDAKEKAGQGQDKQGE